MNAPTQRPPAGLDVAVFARNEAAAIIACIEAIDRSCESRGGRISVLLNGTTDNSAALLRAVRPAHAVLAVYGFPVADKSNAINHFLYSIRDPAAAAHIFVDGYVRIDRCALDALADALAAHPRAHLAAGVPTTGRFARVVADAIRTGQFGLSGNLFAMRPSFAERIAAAGIRLPRGLYRGDGLIGTWAKRDLNALSGEWDGTRIVAVPAAAYQTPQLSPFRWTDWRRQYNREVRQALGHIENKAIQEIIFRDGFAALPADSSDMVRPYLARHGLPAGSLRQRFFARQAVARLRPTADGPPELIFQTAPPAPAVPHGAVTAFVDLAVEEP